MHTDNSTGLGFGSHGKPAAELLRSCQQQQHPLPASFPPRQQSPRAANMAWNRRIPPLSDPLRPPSPGVSPAPCSACTTPGVPFGADTEHEQKPSPDTPHKQKPSPHHSQLLPVSSSGLGEPSCHPHILTRAPTSPGAPGHFLTLPPAPSSTFSFQSSSSSHTRYKGAF